jgi:hypothetical protein
MTGLWPLLGTTQRLGRGLAFAISTEISTGYNGSRSPCSIGRDRASQARSTESRCPTQSSMTSNPGSNPRSRAATAAVAGSMNFEVDSHAVEHFNPPWRLFICHPRASFCCYAVQKQNRPRFARRRSYNQPINSTDSGQWFLWWPWSRRPGNNPTWTCGSPRTPFLHDFRLVGGGCLRLPVIPMIRASANKAIASRQGRPVWRFLSR